MKKISLIFILVVFMFSCEKTNKVCNCDNPIENLPWLKEIKTSLVNCSCQITIFQATYSNQTVFYSRSNDPLCNGVQEEIHLYNCNGTIIKTYLDGEALMNDISGQKEIYICKTKK